MVSEVPPSEVQVGGRLAERDFTQIRGLDLSNSRTRFQLIENVFVRAFAKLVGDGDARIGQWRQYIDGFRGAQEYDYSKIQAHLALEYSIGRLPERDAIDAAAVQQVYEYLLDAVEASKLQVDRKLRDKAMRDAELYVSLVTHTRRLRAADPGSACLLVSSARRLGDVDRHFGLSGEVKLVVSVPTALYLISMMPNVSLGLSSMRTFLFDEGRVRFSSELERTLLRMIQTSDEFSMPFAKRATLMREVRSRLLDGASRQQGRPSVADVEKRALRDDAQGDLISTLSKSLDAIAVDTRAEREVRQLKQQVIDLQRRLDAQKRRGG